jgi:hypothetical protein
VPHSCHETGQIGTAAMSPTAIAAGHAWCPRQDSNLRHRLRKPVNQPICGARSAPTRAPVPLDVSLVAPDGAYFVPYGVPRRRPPQTAAPSGCCAARIVNQPADRWLQMPTCGVSTRQVSPPLVTVLLAEILGKHLGAKSRRFEKLLQSHGRRLLLRAPS